MKVKSVTKGGGRVIKWNKIALRNGWMIPYTDRRNMVYTRFLFVRIAQTVHPVYILNILFFSKYRPIVFLEQSQPDLLKQYTYKKACIPHHFQLVLYTFTFYHLHATYQYTLTFYVFLHFIMLVDFIFYLVLISFFVIFYFSSCFYFQLTLNAILLYVWPRLKKEIIIIIII